MHFVSYTTCVAVAAGNKFLFGISPSINDEARDAKFNKFAVSSAALISVAVIVI